MKCLKHALLVLLASFIFLQVISQVSSVVYYYSAKGRIFTIPTYGTYIGFSTDRTFTTCYRENDYWYFNNAIEVYRVQVQNANMTITKWFESNWLNFTVEAASGTSTSKFYVGLKGDPTSVDGESAYSYDAGTKILEINVTHTSSEQVSVSWGTSAVFSVYFDLGIQGVKINGSYTTNEQGYYEWTNLTKNQIYVFEVEKPSSYYPGWCLNVTESFSWNGTHYILSHNLTSVQTYVDIYFPSVNEPYISEATGKLLSVSSSYTRTRNVIFTTSGEATVTIYTEERFTPDYYAVTGYTDWFWNGLTNEFEVTADGTVTVAWR